MFKKVSKYTVLMIASASMLVLSGCIIDDYHHGPSPYAQGYYHYYYYPSVRVYYDTRRHVYFYHHRRHGWVRSRHLPNGYILKRQPRYKLKMRQERPYVRYREHQRRYPHRFDSHRGPQSRGTRGYRERGYRNKRH